MKAEATIEAEVSGQTRLRKVKRMTSLVSQETKVPPRRVISSKELMRIKFITTVLREFAHHPFTLAI